MTTSDALEKLLAYTDAYLHSRGDATPVGDPIVIGKKLVNELRAARQFDHMLQVAELVSRRDPKDVENRRLYAQALIETGKVTAAIDVLQAASQGLSKSDPEWPEVKGLLGRCNKQIFIEAVDKTGPEAREALQQAIVSYRQPYEEAPAANYWHGVNLAALLTKSLKLGLPIPQELDPKTIAQNLCTTLEAITPATRDIWSKCTLAEANLTLDNWDAFERYIGEFAQDPDTHAFAVASCLRQLTEVWDLDKDRGRGRGVIDALNARLMMLPGGKLVVGPKELRELSNQKAPPQGQLEAILGVEGTKTYNWWQTGLARARSVASIRLQLGNRQGTGFLLTAGDLGLDPKEDLVVLTNFHVVNERGSGGGLQPDAVEVIFEAVNPSIKYSVDSIIWGSDQDHHDATLLKLKQHVEGVEPMVFAKQLPILQDEPRVYIIGHAGGQELAFSFQDNELIAHEGPPDGKPGIPHVCRLHYRAPTEGGSSGSPVFNALWQIVALHHKGGKTGMPKLNGEEGTYAANEGISIQSIREAIKTNPKGITSS